MEYKTFYITKKIKITLQNHFVFLILKIHLYVVTVNTNISIPIMAIK